MRIAVMSDIHGVVLASIGHLRGQRQSTGREFIQPHLDELRQHAVKRRF